MRVWIAYVIEELEDPRFAKGTIVTANAPKPYTEPDGVARVLYMADVTTRKVWKAARVIGLGVFTFDNEEDMRRRLVDEVKRKLREVMPEEAEKLEGAMRCH